MLTHLIYQKEVSGEGWLQIIYLFTRGYGPVSDTYSLDLKNGTSTKEKTISGGGSGSFVFGASLGASITLQKEEHKPNEKDGN